MIDEPLAMTLAEAMAEVKRRQNLYLVTDGHDWALLERTEWPAAWGVRPGTVRDSWTEAASLALGYAVVERDVTAELVKAVKAVLSRITYETPRGSTLCRFCRQEGHADHCVAHTLRAALAAVGEGEA